MYIDELNIKQKNENNNSSIQNSTMSTLCLELTDDQ